MAVILRMLLLQLCCVWVLHSESVQRSHMRAVQFDAQLLPPRQREYIDNNRNVIYMYKT